eukprot:267351-Prorocentrum_minimum.AAC.2
MTLHAEAKHPGLEGALYRTRGAQKVGSSVQGGCEGGLGAHLVRLEAPQRGGRVGDVHPVGVSVGEAVAQLA